MLSLQTHHSTSSYLQTLLLLCAFTCGTITAGDEFTSIVVPFYLRPLEPYEDQIVTCTKHCTSTTVKLMAVGAGLCVGKSLINSFSLESIPVETRISSVGYASVGLAEAALLLYGANYIHEIDYHLINWHENDTPAKQLAAYTALVATGAVVTAGTLATCKLLGILHS